MRYIDYYPETPMYATWALFGFISLLFFDPGKSFLVIGVFSIFVILIWSTKSTPKTAAFAAGVSLGSLASSVVYFRAISSFLEQFSLSWATHLAEVFILLMFVWYGTILEMDCVSGNEGRISWKEALKRTLLRSIATAAGIWVIYGILAWI